MMSFAFALLFAAAMPAQPATSEAKTLTVTGCVKRDETRPGNWFTLSDKTTGATYRLTGPRVKAYVWRNVRIVGGLVPSPNIAAQAGAIDPTKAAIASQGGNPSGLGAADLPEFRVNSVRLLTGTCLPGK